MNIINKKARLCLMSEKWEKVEITFTDEERRSFKNALVIFAIIEALVLIPLMLYRIFS